MKLNKKFIGTLLAIILVASCGIVAVSALEEAWPCCDNYRGTAERILYHDKMGPDCIAEIETYCPECGTIFDHYSMTFGRCPHTGVPDDNP